jgi:uncharacterized membrane protein YbhN (UPF0104 family)
MPGLKLPKRAYRWLRWVVALVAMVFVVHKLASDPEPLRRIAGTGPEVLFGMCCLIVVNQALISLRFKLVMENTGATGIAFMAWFRLTSVGQMLNLFVPQLGNLYRGVTLKRDHGISYLAYATGLVSFVWLDAMMGMSIAFMVILVLEPSLELAGVSALLVLACMGTAIALGPIVAAAITRRLRQRGGAWGKLQQRLTTLLETTSRVARSPGLMLRFFLLNIVVTVCQTTSLWLAFHAVGGGISPSGLVLFQVLIKLSNQVVITPGNLGITELAFGALAHGSERTLNQGLAVSLLLRAVGTVVVSVLGLLWGGASFLTSKRHALLTQVDELEGGAQPLPATRK